MSRFKTCGTCHRPIYQGDETVRIENGVMTESKKSGRLIDSPQDSILIHKNCLELFMASPESGQIYDTVKEIAYREVDMEVTENIKDDLREEVRNEMIDYFGKFCVECGEEINRMAEPEEDEPPYRRQPARPPVHEQIAPLPSGTGQMFFTPRKK